MHQARLIIYLLSQISPLAPLPAAAIDSLSLFFFFFYLGDSHRKISLPETKYVCIISYAVRDWFYVKIISNSQLTIHWIPDYYTFL